MYSFFPCFSKSSLQQVTFSGKSSGVEIHVLLCWMRQLKPGTRSWWPQSSNQEASFSPLSHVRAFTRNRHLEMLHVRYRRSVTELPAQLPPSRVPARPGLCRAEPAPPPSGGRRSCLCSPAPICPLPCRLGNAAHFGLCTNKQVPLITE